MKYLFVSPDLILQQSYRHNALFRWSAALMILTVIGQIPMVIYGLMLWNGWRTESNRADLIATKMFSIQKEDQPLTGPRLKLKQIRLWEPIFKDRLPVGVLLSSIENAIPDSAEIDSITLESDQFKKVPVKSGVYRVPLNYRLVIQGQVKKGDAADQFEQRLRDMLPAGSEMIRSERSEKQGRNQLIAFVIQYAVKPSGNYHAPTVNQKREYHSL
jgi:hypothetical protein